MSSSRPSKGKQSTTSTASKGGLTSISSRISRSFAARKASIDRRTLDRLHQRADSVLGYASGDTTKEPSILDLDAKYDKMTGVQQTTFDAQVDTIVEQVLADHQNKLRALMADVDQSIPQTKPGSFSAQQTLYASEDHGGDESDWSLSEDGQPADKDGDVEMSGM
ncbi:uncharacterized protein I303_103991 [Kwoniella dejecticola CBS 10117]|uniref:Uncharacterized protein n=1 Tax=Kwoniella dejecticola CBS 10117 TaxID=1296121 RepID=A0A1A6A8A7_9TREE|nr:uncharacterized protein I303_04008 [Kwoniella dejecticola CBS 10117]OBR86286.1 hypothetical protein I303_04008 [Kwoniella dejecticola CBS 10117]